MTDEELAEKVGYALYVERPLELDQEGGDDWDIVPDEWREEWIDAGRVAVAAVKKARRLTRPRAQESADPVRCPKCGGPHPFHDPACMVHPDLIQDHNEQEQR